MKLYEVDLICNHCEEYFGLVITNNEEEAIEKVKKDYGISFTYSEKATELNEIDGYKVVFPKGKKIELINS